MGAMWGQDNSTFSYNQVITTAGATSVPYYIVPAPAVEPEPVDDSAIGWLRKQVSEITELAQATT